MKETPTFFRRASDFRAWLHKHHTIEDALWVGYYKKDSGKPSLTWPESVDAALCFGWIDGVRKNIDDISYKIRFTPRKPRSIWSAVNITRAQALIDHGLMQAAGVKAYEARQENKSGIYSYEQRSVALEEPYDRLFKSKHRKAWDFFQTQPASYRKAASWWIVSAKKEETRLARLERLAFYSAKGERLPQLTPRKPAR